jgi:hypothetical protein
MSPTIDTAHIRTAYSCSLDVAEAFRACRGQLGAAEPDLILAFIGGKHDPKEALTAAQQVFGEVPVVGGSAAGAISPSGYGYTGFEVGLAAFTGPDVTPTVFFDHDLREGEVAAGRRLGEAVRMGSSDGAVAMLMFDSVAELAPLKLHPASRLTAGFLDGLGSRQLHVIGGGLLTDINMSDGWVFHGGEVRKHTVIALLFPPGIRASTVILHGCRPVSSFLDITRIEGAEVLELNGERALDVVEKMLGIEIGTTSGQQLSLIATLGEKQGDPFAPYDENNYVNRLILRADPVRGSITLFEPDFTVGTRVQIMSRDNLLMLESVERGVSNLNGAIKGQDCLLSMYIDCAGRASVMSGAATEEAELVLATLDSTCPFVGFYSGVEIAPFKGHYSRPLDWTGVLSVLTRNR